MIDMPYYTHLGCKVTVRHHVERTEHLQTDIILECEDEKQHTGSNINSRRAD